MTDAPNGVFAPVVTTFYPESGDVDLASFAANVRAHLAAGLHGVVVTGSTGEAALLDWDERAARVDTCLPQAHARCRGSRRRCGAGRCAALLRRSDDRSGAVAPLPCGRRREP